MARYKDTTVFDNVAVSGTTVYNSTAIDISHCQGFSGVLTVTGTPVGVLKMQASQNGTTWVDVDASEVINVSAAGNYFINAMGQFYKFARAVYTNASSTGAITLVLSFKGD